MNCTKRRRYMIWSTRQNLKKKKQAVNAHNVRALSFYLTKTVCDDKPKVTISDQGKC